MKEIKLGIIGLSPGNGHPYSWSAIFNGYNPKYMKNCPFPVIPQYLSKQKFPRDCIKNAKVTHIWTQDKKLSEHIAKSSNIKNIVTNYEDLIGQVDGILLARDDYQNHYKMSKKIIQEGLPIYIDKPLTIKTTEAKRIFSLEKFENQIFTCSALSFAKEFNLTKKDLSRLGKIKHVDAYVMKDWDKYGIHIIEPVLKLLITNKIIKLQDIPTHKSVTNQNDKKIVTFAWPNNLTTSFCALGQTPTPIKIRIFGEKTNKEMTFENTFFAFKKALTIFTDIISNKQKNPYSKEFILKMIKTIEDGNNNE